MPTPCRMPNKIGTYGEYIAMWPRDARDSDCTGGSIHSSRWRISDNWRGRKCPSLHAKRARGWKGACDRCGQAIPWDQPTVVSVSSSMGPVYDTKDGRLQPGDMFYVPHWGEWCPGGWTNCDGQHLHAILPNGLGWDIDGRASNCTLPDDTTHRCWVRDGTPPNVTAGKAGHTCSAGAGSILSGDYHGFLRGGVLT